MTKQDFENQAIERIKQHEGFRGELYLDQNNQITGGYGHNFSCIMPRKLAELILQYDFEIARHELDQCISLPALTRLPYAKYYVLVEMMFQLGAPRFQTFVKMIDAIEKGDCKEAAKEMRDSVWWREQTQNRAEALARIMESEE